MKKANPVYTPEEASILLGKKLPYEMRLIVETFWNLGLRFEISSVDGRKAKIFPVSFVNGNEWVAESRECELKEFTKALTLAYSSMDGKADDLSLLKLGKWNDWFHGTWLSKFIRTIQGRLPWMHHDIIVLSPSNIDCEVPLSRKKGKKGKEHGYSWTDYNIPGTPAPKSCTPLAICSITNDDFGKVSDACSWMNYRTQMDELGSDWRKVPKWARRIIRERNKVFNKGTIMGERLNRWLLARGFARLDLPSNGEATVLSEAFSKGKFLLSLNKHTIAIQDGVVHDDSFRREDIDAPVVKAWEWKD